MHRREFIRQFGYATLALGTGVPVAGRAGATDSAQLSAVIEINGRQFRYLERSGVNLGDFRGEGFVQRCMRVTLPDSPLTVYFRPDSTSDRVEVVFELGRLWGTVNAAAAHLGAYKAMIYRGGQVLSVVDVPKHWWMSRWRWQSAPRPVIHTVSNLIASHMLFPISNDIARTAAPIRFDKCVYDLPMDRAGIYVEMDSSGERPDIGPITEWQAVYINTQRDEALKAVLAQSEASGSMPIHYRDENTGGPIDFFQYPEANWYYQRQGKTWIRGYESITEKGRPTAPWRMSSAHDPAVNFLPYVLTGDPYFLEELQFQGTQLLGWTAYNRGATKLQIVDPSQTRSFAWSLRTIFQLARVTPDSTPKWMKPRGYWKRILDDNKRWFTETYVRNPSPATSVFHAATQLTSVGPWQEEFLAFILGLGVWMGFEDWKNAYLWKLQSTLARTNGRSGWPRQFCTPYYFKIGQSLPESVLYASTVDPGRWYKSWKEAWDAFKANPNHAIMFKSRNPEVFTDDVSWQENTGKDYLIYTRGVLATATQLGVTDAVEPYEFVNNMVDRLGFMTNRWSFTAATS